MINNCAIRSVLATSLVLLSLSAGAFQSEFITTQKADMGYVKASIASESLRFSDRETRTTESGEYSGIQSATVFGLNYDRTFADNWSFNFGGEFISRRLSADTRGGAGNINSASFSSMGIRSLNLGAKGGVVFEPATLTYGLLTRLSPGPSRLSWDSSSISNTNLGYNTYSPWIGVESFVGQLAVHGSATWNLYSAISEELGSGIAQTAIAENEYTLSGGIEMPAAKKVNIGLTASVGRTDANFFKMVTGEANSLYGAKIFSTYELDRDTVINIGLAGESRKVPFSSENSSIELGMNRAL